MRTFLILVALGALTLSGCVVGVHGHHRHGFHHRGHHSRHHWNHAGEAYNESSKIRHLTILPVTLPAKFEGKYFEQEEQQWRRDWPTQAARTVASAVSMNTDTGVVATASETAPTEGYYLALTITEFTLGDREKSAQGPEPEGWAKLTTTGKIMNAKSNQVVVELTFEVSCVRYTDTPPIDNLSQQVGNSLADWFREKKAEAGRPGNS